MRSLGGASVLPTPKRTQERIQPAAKGVPYELSRAARDKADCATVTAWAGTNGWSILRRGVSERGYNKNPGSVPA